MAQDTQPSLTSGEGVQEDTNEKSNHSENDNQKPDLQEDLGIYEDHAEADELTDSDEEEQSPAIRHVRITSSKDHRKRERTSAEDGRLSRTAKMTEMKFGTEDEEKLRKKNNTPASALTEYSELKSAEFRGGSHNSEAREIMFRRAMNLMANRCTSRISDRGTAPLVSMQNPPYGIHEAKYFYITQKRPAPMPPMKAWRGYHGSVYFEPIQVNNLAISQSLPPTPNMEGYSSKLRNAVSRRSMATPRLLSSRVSNKENRPTPENEWNENAPYNPSRAKSQMSSITSARSLAGSRKMCILDRGSVFRLFNENIHDDIIWLKNQASTGSLRILAKDEDDTGKRQRLEKQKIMKGSVAHRLFLEKMGGGGATEIPTKIDSNQSSKRSVQSVTLPKERKTVSSLSSSTCHVPFISANTPDQADVEVYSTGKIDKSEKLPPLDSGQLNTMVSNNSNFTQNRTLLKEDSVDDSIPVISPQIH